MSSPTSPTTASSSLPPRASRKSCGRSLMLGTSGPMIHSPTSGSRALATSWTRISQARRLPLLVRRPPLRHRLSLPLLTTPPRSPPRMLQMPELPEVEYVAQQLREDLVGRRIEAVEVRWERSIEGLPAAELAARLRGRRVVGVGRRGKYLLIEFDEGPSLAIHRRMSGNLYFAAPDADEPYARVRFLLDDGRALVYSDPRKFGRLSLLEEGRVPPGLAALGPE